MRQTNSFAALVLPSAQPSPTRCTLFRPIGSATSLSLLPLLSLLCFVRQIFSYRYLAAHESAQITASFLPCCSGCSSGSSVVRFLSESVSERSAWHLDDGAAHRFRR
jgi:hypothetical protein